MNSFNPPAFVIDGRWHDGWVNRNGAYTLLDLQWQDGHPIEASQLADIRRRTRLAYDLSGWAAWSWVDRPHITQKDRRTPTPVREIGQSRPAETLRDGARFHSEELEHGLDGNRGFIRI